MKYKCTQFITRRLYSPGDRINLKLLELKSYYYRYGCKGTDVGRRKSLYENITKFLIIIRQ